jgi:hypothetical protein
MRTTLSKDFETFFGKYTFTLTQLGGRQAGKLFVRVGPHIPRLIGSIASLDSKQLKDKDGKLSVESLKKLDLSKLNFPALGEALAKVTPEDFDSITCELLKGGIAIGKNEAGEDQKVDLDPAAIDQLFRGQVWQLFALVGFAIEVNYGGF